MKRTLLTLAIAVAFLAATVSSFATIKEVVIATSAQCNSCKTKIEKSVNDLSGIINVTLDVSDKTATVKYDDQVTTLDKIKKAISMVGYRADDVAADPKAYKLLPDHCKGVAMVDPAKIAPKIDKQTEVKTNDAKTCGTSCKDKPAEAKASCCPKGCADKTADQKAATCPSGTTMKMECKTGDTKATTCPSGTTMKMENCKPGEAKSCCPSTSTVKIDGKATLDAKCSKEGCTVKCPDKATAKPTDTKIK